MRAVPELAAPKTALSLLTVLSLVSGVCPCAALADSGPDAGQWLVIKRVGHYGRAPVHTDAIEARIVAGRWSVPSVGDEVAAPDGVVRAWEAVTPDDEGWLKHDALRGGYACWVVESDAERVMVLEPRGHATVYVNGVPRAGDTYNYGWLQLPVQLHAGTNTFLFHVGRGKLRACLTEPAADVFFNLRDATLPDVVRGEDEALWAALPVVNATGRVQETLVVEASCAGVEPLLTRLPSIPAMSLRKVGFRIPPMPTAVEDEIEVTVRLLSGDVGDEPLDTKALKLNVHGPRDKHKRTFVSEIDGSVQYYAVTPAHPETDSDVPLALFLSVHGASVEATGQAYSYAHKDWGHIVAPTNRRPYGFDWEDWGRMDALEVLALVCGRWEIDPQRIYLTGHSMGGHGVWHLGVMYPDLFAAIGPSAAWPDFFTYGGAPEYEHPTPVESILARAVSPSRTLTLSRNYLHYGVYILHGENDDDVPVSLARKMRRHLAEFHADFAYYERPGVGHWWGRECVDWPPMFEFFRQHTRPDSRSLRRVEFYTANPGISASSHWVTIDAQLRLLEPSSVVVELDSENRRFVGRTVNVARLALDLALLGTTAPDAEAQDRAPLPPGEPLAIELDDQTLDDIAWPDGGTQLWLQRTDAGWAVSEPPAPILKGRRRYGPFKAAFRNRCVFVCGTRGTAEESAAAWNKARYDAETFWYRGNGAADIIADEDFVASGDTYQDRNVILYGNAETNAAWGPLLGDSPVQVRGGRVTIGERELVGDELACLFVRPRAGSEHTLVGVVAGTGVAGMRLTHRLPYFLAGVAYPDCIVLGPEMLREGTGGIRAAGFFGLDWSVTNGDFAWQED